MGKMKRLAPGVFRRSDGEIVLKATAWKRRGRRERVLPAKTKLYDAIKKRQEFVDELKGEPKPASSSLTFHDYVELYRKNTGEHAQTSLVNDIDRELGHLAIPQVEEGFTIFIEHHAHRNRMVWRGPKLHKKLVDTGKPISEATIKGYLRYFKAICGAAKSYTTPKEIRLSEDNDPSAGLKIGKAPIRRRPLTPPERQAIIETATRLYPFLLPAILFSMTMPVRPGDLCSLKWTAIDELHSQVPYLPEKTKKTGVCAYPLILPNVREFIMGRIGDSECPYIFYSVDESGKRVPLTYNRISSAWHVILREKVIKDLRVYDLRHDAVSFCLNAGFTTRDVMAFAGWSNVSMVDGYDTRDRIRLAERAKEILASGSLDRYTVNATIKTRGDMRGKYGT